MSTTESMAVFLRRKRVAKPYVITVDQRSGAMYLKRERSAIFAELPYVTVMLISILFALISYFQYIQLHTSINFHVRHTEVLERQIENLKNDNKAKEKDLSYIKDMDYIYDTAVHSLGMVPVTEGHVVFYEKSNREYVYQRDNIPIIGLK